MKDSKIMFHVLEFLVYSHESWERLINCLISLENGDIFCQRSTYRHYLKKVNKNTPWKGNDDNILDNGQHKFLPFKL